MKKKGRVLADLFFTFMKIGAFTFGGGYAMIPLIQREASERKGWIAEDEMIDIVAVAESTPGPVAVNAATYIGQRTAGFFGALLSTLGVILPSFAVILAVSFLLENFAEIRAVRYAFIGIRAAVLALIVKALVMMYRQCPKSPVSYVLMCAAFCLVTFLKIPVVIVIGGCAVFGLVSCLLIRGRGKK